MFFVFKNNQSVKIRLIRQIRERTDLLTAIEQRLRNYALRITNYALLLVSLDFFPPQDMMVMLGEAVAFVADEL